MAVNVIAPDEDRAELVFKVIEPAFTVSGPATVHGVPSVRAAVFVAFPTRTEVESEETAKPVRLTAAPNEVSVEVLSITLAPVPPRVNVLLEVTAGFEI